MPLDLSAFEPLLDEMLAAKLRERVYPLRKGFSLLGGRIPYDEWLDRNDLKPRSKETRMSKWKRREHGCYWRQAATDDILLVEPGPLEGRREVYVVDGETRMLLPMETEPMVYNARHPTHTRVAIVEDRVIDLPTWVFKQLYEPVPEKVSAALELVDCRQLRDAIFGWPAGSAILPSATKTRIMMALNDAIDAADNGERDL